MRGKQTAKSEADEEVAIIAKEEMAKLTNRLKVASEKPRDQTHSQVVAAESTRMQEKVMSILDKNLKRVHSKVQYLEAMTRTASFASGMKIIYIKRSVF